MRATPSKMTASIKQGLRRLKKLAAAGKTTDAEIFEECLWRDFLDYVRAGAVKDPVLAGQADMLLTGLSEIEFERSCDKLQKVREAVG